MLLKFCGKPLDLVDFVKEKILKAWKGGYKIEGEGP